MKIAEIFRNEITRDIPEVIKVDFGDDDVVANEIDEYVVTDHIAESFETLLDQYEENSRNPNEETNIWVSGFFGSGKSSFAKILGYLLANPTVKGRSARERFLARVNSPRIEALLNTIHDRVPTHAVFVDMSTGSNVVAREGESVVLPLYRALLESLGYSRNIMLAELEFDLETDGELDAFIDAFSRIPDSKGAWEQRRNVGLARAEASYAMHLLHSELYPQADSWNLQATDPVIDANWFADRAIELLKRRGKEAERTVFVVDEVGQYVARSVQRIQHLQGLAEALQKKRGRLWLVVTSQEKLEDVVDSLEGRRVELARVQARFPLRVDLLPADIDEVAGKRVLDKNAPGEREVRDVLAPHRNKLSANVRLNSPARAEDLAEDEFVRLYPLLPYQIDVLIAAVSARRAQGGNVPMLGGSNRTIIKLAQQLMIDPRVGLGNRDVGALVTLDRAYDLLEAIIPTAWQGEIRRVADRCGEDSLEVGVAKAVALTMDVPALPLDATNLAVMLHSSVAAESNRDEVAKVLERLVKDEVVRQSDAGYRLQSPQEKDWEKTRKGIDPRPADLVRLRRELLRASLSGLSVSEGRTFKVEITVEGERIIDGDIALRIEEGDTTRVAELRTASREPNAAATIWWSVPQSDDTYDALVEVFRSKEMIARRDTAARASDELELLGEERTRLARHEIDARRRLAEDLLRGQLIFQGNLDDPRGGELRAVAIEAIRARVRAIYTRIDLFSAGIGRADVMTVLKADDLRGLHPDLSDAGIGVTRVTPDGLEIAVDRDPLKVLIDEIRRRVSYGNEATGAYLEKTFSAPPYGATVEVIQALAAAAIRAGVVEVISQGARITRRDDTRLEGVFRTLPSFRAASFRLQADDEVDLEVRTKVAERLGELTGAPPSPVIDALGPLLRSTFASDAEACDRVGAALRPLRISVPEAVERTAAIISRLREGSDGETVRTAAETWADLLAGRQVVKKLDAALTDDPHTLGDAIAQVREGPGGLDHEERADFVRLSDLVSGGDLAEYLGQVRTLTIRLAEARRRAREQLLEELREAVDGERQRLRDAFPTVDGGVFDEAARPLSELAADEDGRLSVDALTARLEAVPMRSARVRPALEEVSASGEVARVKVAPLVGDTPITSSEELEIALKRIGDAVEEALGDPRKKQVYLE